MRRLLAIFFSAIGCALFIWVIRQTGVQGITLKLRELGSGFFIILLISSFRYLLRSLSWFRCIQPEQRRVGLWALLRARIAGEAIGDLTVGPVAAEPMRLVAVGGRLAPLAGISSLAVENITYIGSCCIMVMTGGIAFVALIGLEESFRTAMLAAIGAVVLATLISFVVVGRRWRVVSKAAAWLQRFLT